MNHPMVRRQMPLFNGEFDDNACEQFIAAKENLWVEFGYGPWAFVVEGEFAGWGGLQPENGDADLALVLHPRYWGVGKVIYKRIIDIAKKNSLPISQKAIFIYNQLVLFHIETVEVHYLIPCRHEVFHKLLFGIATSVNLCKCSQF